MSNRIKFNNQQRLAILRSYHYRCAICSVKLKKGKFEIDHRIELAENGSNDYYNLQCLCYECHLNKTMKYIDLKISNAENEHQKEYWRKRKIQLEAKMKSRYGFMSNKAQNILLAILLILAIGLAIVSL